MRDTGENIGIMIDNCLCQWDIHSKLLCVLRDGGSNFVSGLCYSTIPNLGCLAHNIQLVISDGVLAQRSVQDLLQLGRRIVGHYRRSNVAFHILQKSPGTIRSEGLLLGSG